MKGKKKGAGFYVANILMVFTSFMIAFPFLWMFTNSIKTKDEIWAMPPRLLPEIPQWINYTDALADGKFFRYMWNSSYTALIITIIVLINSTMFAYALVNIRFKGKGVLIALIMVTYIMPATTTYVPAYVILSKMGMMNTHLGYIFCALHSGRSIRVFWMLQGLTEQDIGTFCGESWRPCLPHLL